MKARLAPSLWLLLPLAMLTFLLSACTDAGKSSDQGRLYLSLTDAPGDFLVYRVNVSAITLYHTNGERIDLPLQSVAVDFAQYTELSELLSGQDLPAGRYVRVDMQLDYSQAEIVVLDEADTPLRIEKFLNMDNEPISMLSVSVTLEPRHGLRLAPGIPAHLSLDFNLRASHQVVFGDPPHLIVQPTLEAQVDPVHNKPHRLRALLHSVDTDASTIEVELKPFHCRKGDFGNATVEIDENTSIEIGDVVYNAEEGLALLATLPPGTSLVILARIRNVPFGIVAEEIRVDAEVPDVTLDLLSGHVIQRDENTLIIQGSLHEQGEEASRFYPALEVNMDAATRIVRQNGKRAPLSTSAVDIGQKVLIKGHFSEEAAPPSLDATGNASGVIRLRHTTIRGRLLETGEFISIALESIDRIPVSQFDFSSSEADPDIFRIKITKNRKGLQTGDQATFRGIMSPYRIDAGVDFLATRPRIVLERNDLLKIAWPKSISESPFTTDWPQLMQVDTGQAGVMVRLLSASEKTEVPEILTIDGVEKDGVYLIVTSKGPQRFTDFPSFIGALAQDMEDGGKLAALRARGEFNKQTAGFLARNLQARLRPATPE